MRFVKIPSILSTAPDLSYVVVRKQHRESTETISIVKPQSYPYFGWFITFRSVIALRFESTAANKLRWNICPDKIHYWTHYNLINFALVLFEVAESYLFSTYWLQAVIFKIPASAKSAVKDRPGQWNADHPATLVVSRAWL